MEQVILEINLTALITGSLLTFEHEENGQTVGFDKVIMLVGRWLCSCRSQ